MTSVLVVDNYDSFTYNLVQYLGELGADVDVVRNDLPELLERSPDRVIVSNVQKLMDGDFSEKAAGGPSIVTSPAPGAALS